MAGSYDQFFHDLAVRESVGVFDQNALPNYQALGANGLNCLGAYQFEGWAMINLGYYKDDGKPNANQWSADSWNGSPQFAVGVDGKQQGGTQTATAYHADGKTQDLTLSGAFGTGVHDVAVTFLNDTWGGTPSTDHNLYVNSIDDNGKHYASATAALMTNGTVHFQVGTANGT